MSREEFVYIDMIALDADDTLWENEPFFKESEKQFCQLLDKYGSQDEISQLLLQIEKEHLPTFGYGVKAFTLSMIETATRISNHQVTGQEIQEIIRLGAQQVHQPVHLLENVELVVQYLKDKYQLVCITKGNLLEQELKVEKSGIKHHFESIHIVSEKNPDQYKHILDNKQVNPDSFMMIGNSMKSDILPVLELGAHAIHIPFHTTWEHEIVNEKVIHPKLRTCGEIKELLNIL